MKRGLVVVYDPHALMQFIQFYCIGDNKEIQWDALCLPKENGRQEMDNYCKKAEIFSNIYVGEKEFMNLPIIKKILLFLPMVFFAVLGRQDIFARKIFSSMVENIDSYDCFVANCESGLMSGMMTTFADNKDVIYFEDGAADYVLERDRKHSRFRKGSFLDFQCILLAKLGYCGKGFIYFEPTKKCIKYASNPKELKYYNYKEIRTLKLDDGIILYKKIISKIYPELKKYEEIKSDDVSLVCTIPLSAQNKYCAEYKKQFLSYISARAKTIIIKKHPRDTEEYIFDENIKVTEIPRDIPAELIFPYFVGSECYMMEPDSLLINMNDYNIHLNILFGIKYHEELQKTYFANKKEVYINLCDRFVAGKYKFVCID